MRRASVTATMALAVYLLLGSSASAEESGVWNAEMAATLCNDKDNRYCEAAFLGYVRGLNDAIAFPAILHDDSRIKNFEPDFWWSCIEKSRASVPQMTKMFRNSLEEHPEQWQQAATLFFFEYVVFPLCHQLAVDNLAKPNAQSTEPAE